MTETDAIRAFEDAVRKRGIIPPPEGIVADGKIKRCAVEGTPHKRDGSILLFGDSPISGGFQNWRDGKEWETWTVGNGNGSGSKLSAEEVRAAKARQEKIRQARDKERADRQKEAAADARKIWDTAGPADPSHPYLMKKKIVPNGLRAGKEGLLIVPMTDENGSLVNIQRINATGEKRFLPGGKVAGTFSSFGPTPDPSGPVVLTEGVATGLSVFEATGFPVVAALSADNLPTVARIFRTRHPKAKLIIFADHDTKETHGHARGIEAAEEAAKPTGACIAISPIPGDDANDLYAREGAEAVRAAIDAAMGVAEVKETPEEDPPLILDPAAPLDCARAYLERKHTLNGERTLLHHRGEFFSWAGTDYRTASEGAVRCDLWGFLDGALQRKKTKEAEVIVSFKPNKVRIGDVFDGLRAAANVPETVEPPAFLDAPEEDARNLLALNNGLLDVVTRKVIAHTPRFFNRGSADYDHNPNATSPTWEKTLDDWFDDDLESRDTLEEILGLLLIPETKYHKLFLLVGPRRSGKGTVGRLIPKLLGARNVVTPTMANLGDRFGLQEAIGKSVAVIGDARLKADAEEVAERLLTISGADGISIPRKYLPDWNGSPVVRFVLLSNETPQINDPSGALASRFVVVQFTESFLGREDLDLDRKLEAERSGILNRCVAGLKRLTERGRFLQPTKGLGAIKDIEALGSPMTTFLEEMTESKKEYSVPVEALYLAWRSWCERNGRDYPGNLQRFGRDLRTARGGKLDTSRPREDGARVRCYEGMRLK